MDVDDILSICHTLESVLSDAYGPRGLKTMITTSIGKVIVTSDGSTILGALNLSHPLANLIAKSANEIAKHHGGSFKTYILYITGAMETLARLSEKHCSCLDQRAAFRLKISQNLKKIALKDLTRKLEEILIRQHLPQLDNWQEIYCQVIHTELSSDFSLRQVQHFTKLLNSFILEGVARPLEVSNNAQVVISHFKELFIKINNSPFTNSKVIDGILLKQQFSVYVDGNSDSPVNFLVLQSNLIDDGYFDKYNIEIKSEKVMENSLTQKQEKIEEFLKVCRHFGINVIFSTEKLLNSFLYLCKLHNISVVEHISEEDANRLVRICQVLAIHNAMDIKDNICQAASCSNVTFGGVSFIQVSFSRKDRLILSKQILVCSIGDSQCEEIYQALNKCVKIVSQVCIPSAYVSKKYNNRKLMRHSFVSDAVENSSSVVENNILDTVGSATIENKIGSGSEDNTGPPCFEDQMETNTFLDKIATTIEDKIGTNLEDKIEPSSIKDKIGPSSIEDKIGPSFILDKIEPSSIEDKIGPFSIEDKIGPSSIENKILPSSIENKIGKSCIEDKIGPSSIEDKIEPCIKNQIESFTSDCSKEDFYPMEHPSVIPGGGAFELYVEDYVKKLCDNSDVHFKLAGEIIIGAVSKVPQCLVKNSTKDGQKQFLEKRKQVFQEISLGCSQSINGNSGMVERFSETLEPISMKVTVLLKALTLISQMLCLDKMR